MLTVSFHSHKGGSGATTTLVNTIPFLVNKLQATKENPILIVDTDIDTSSLTYLLETDDNFHNAYDFKTLIEGVMPGKNNRDSINNHPFFNKCLKIGGLFDLNNDSVYFLGLDDIKEFDTDDITRSADTVIYELKRLCKQLNFKALIFDLSAGDDFLSNLLTRMSKVIVTPLRVTKQSMIGTKKFLDRLDNIMIDLDTDEQFRRLIIVPNATPQKDLTLDGENQHTKSINLIKEELKGYKYEINCELVSDEIFGIGEIERFKWQEGILYNLKDDLDEDEMLALTRYEKLADMIISEGDK